MPRPILCSAPLPSSPVDPRDVHPRETVRRAARRWVIAACAAIALGAATGCVAQPTVSVHHAVVRSSSLSGVEVLVYLEVDNGNSYDVEIRAIRASVSMEGHRLSPIDVRPKKWLRAGRTTLVAVPVTIPWSVVPTLLSKTAGSSSITYRVKGWADVTAGRSMRVQRNNDPVIETGKIPRRLVAGMARSMSPF